MSAVLSSALQIRPFQAGDGPACDRIYLEGRRDAFSWCAPSQFNAGEFAGDAADEIVVVAEHAGEVVGFLSYLQLERFIHLLFVDGRHRRGGVGRALLDHAVASIGDGAWLKCQSDNVSALAFYRSQGWHVTPGGKNEIGPWSYVSHRRPISPAIVAIEQSLG